MGAPRRTGENTGAKGARLAGTERPDEQKSEATEKPEELLQELGLGYRGLQASTSIWKAEHKPRGAGEGGKNKANVLFLETCSGCTSKGQSQIKAGSIDGDGSQSKQRGTF